MRKRLAETIEMALVVEPNAHIVVDNMVSEWGSSPYAQLSVLLVHLKWLAALHQNHHWVSSGDSFYGDHLLFQRLYDATNAEIDTVAEKLVGLGGTSGVDLKIVNSQVCRLIDNFGVMTTIPQSSDLAQLSYRAEMTFLKVVSCLVESLSSSGLLTRGLDNMLAGIQDAHENSVYLLKQRIM